LNSLVAIVLQNHRDLDLITAEKGRICMYLGEECLLEKIKARERNKETLEYRMEELGPMGSPPGGAHLLCSLCYYSKGLV
jgi:hypothetical protein